MAAKSQQTTLVLACSLGLALGAPPAFGQSFEELEARIRDHPSLAAIRYQSEALREDAIAVAAWPDPVVSFGVNNFPVFDPSFRSYLPTNKAIGVRQGIPNRSKRDAKSEQARRSAAQSDAIEALQFVQLRAELIIALVEKRRISEQASLLREQDALYNELLKIVQSEIATGRPALFRLAEVDLERAEVARSLAELGGEIAGINARLVDLVGDAGNASPPLLEPVTWTGAADAFHAVRVAQAEISVSDAEVARAQAAWGPDWGLQLTYQQRNRGAAETPFAGDDWVSAAVTFTVPLWGRRSQAPALRAAKAQRESAHSRSLAAARAAEARFSALTAMFRASEAAIVALEEKIAAISEQVDAQRTQYESGVGDYSPGIDGELAELVIRARISHEQARRDRAVAQLNALVVTS